jgi:hypothetical protein
MLHRAREATLSICNICLAEFWSHSYDASMHVHVQNIRWGAQAVVKFVTSASGAAQYHDCTIYCTIQGEMISYWTLKPDSFTVCIPGDWSGHYLYFELLIIYIYISSKA